MIFIRISRLVNLSLFIFQYCVLILSKRTYFLQLNSKTKRWHSRYITNCGLLSNVFKVIVSAYYLRSGCGLTNNQNHSLLALAALNAFLHNVQ